MLLKVYCAVIFTYCYIQTWPSSLSCTVLTLPGAVVRTLHLMSWKSQYSKLTTLTTSTYLSNRKKANFCVPLHPLPPFQCSPAKMKVSSRFTLFLSQCLQFSWPPSNGDACCFYLITTFYKVPTKNVCF